MGIGIPVLCVDGTLSIATVGEVMSIGAAGGVMYNATTNSSGGSGENSDINKNKGNGDEGATKADFYVKPNGDVIPSTGYRYIDSKYAEQTMATKSAPGSYFGFKKIDSVAKVQDAF